MRNFRPPSPTGSRLTGFLWVVVAEWPAAVLHGGDSLAFEAERRCVMAHTMRNVKGAVVREYDLPARESGHKSRLRDVECGTPCPSNEKLVEGAEKLARWLAGESRVMFDDETGTGAE